MSPFINERTAHNRRRVAAVFDALTPQQLATPSLCVGWSVRDVLGHLVMPLAVSMPRPLLQAVRHRSVHKAATVLEKELARDDIGGLTALLRSRADVRVWAPGPGPMGQFVDGCVHLRDVARPLSLGGEADTPLDDWALVLAWLPSRPARLGHVFARLLSGLSFQATDQIWSHGAGPAVEGPSEALALAITGRRASLGDLCGAGVSILADRLRPPTG